MWFNSKLNRLNHNFVKYYIESHHTDNVECHFSQFRIEKSMKCRKINFTIKMNGKNQLKKMHVGRNAEEKEGSALIVVCRAFVVENPKKLIRSGMPTVQCKRFRQPGQIIIIVCHQKMLK